MHQNLFIADPVTNLLSIVIEQRNHRKIRLAETVVVRECRAQTARADDALSAFSYLMPFLLPVFLDLLRLFVVQDGKFTACFCMSAKKFV